jgi:hypothetical protein
VPLRSPILEPVADLQPTRVDDEVETKRRSVLKSLAGSAFFLGSLAAVAGVVLVVVEPPGNSTRGEAVAFGLFALLWSGLWFLGGKGALAGRRWAVVLILVLACINLLGAFVNFINGARFISVVAFLLNAGILTQTDQVFRLDRKRRWTVAANPEIGRAAERGDVVGLVRVLRRDNKDEARAALLALERLGERAAPAVPQLIELVERKVPPEPWQSDRCLVCRKELTVWNKGLGSQLCNGCGQRIQLMKQNPDAVDPSLSELAARVLGGIGPTALTAIPVLERVSRSIDPSLSRAAGEALRQIQGHSSRRVEA